MLTTASAAGYSCSRRALRSLVRHQVEAFSTQPRVRYELPVATRPVFRAAITYELLVLRWRRNDAGTASLALMAKRGRDWPTDLRVVGTVGIFGGWLFAAMLLWPLGGAAVLLGMVVFGGISLRRTRVCAPAARRLRALRPPGPYWLVSSVASVVPGQGAELLRGLLAEADAKGWVLVLEAANSRLIEYYASFGFRPAGPGEAMPWNEVVGGRSEPCVLTCLVRQPQRIGTWEGSSDG